MVIYGRRRIGKTSLIREFIRDKPTVYFLATEEANSINRSFFKDIVAEHLNSSFLMESDANHWETIFESLVQDGQKRVIVIDEFQNLGKADASFLSLFEHIWDTILKDSGVMVVLCESLNSMVTDQALSHSNAPYGSRTGQMRIEQIPFDNYHEFYPGLDTRHLIELYSLTGGIPKYMETLDADKDVYENIKKHIFSPTGLLYEEPYMLLSKEVREIGSYFSILRSIAAGNHKLGNISAFLDVRQGSLTRYLKVLVDLDIIERDVPVTEENPEKSKKGLYRFKDNYLRFWFSYVYPLLSNIEGGHEPLFESMLQKDFIDRHVAYVYEDISRTQMRKIMSVHYSLNISRVGRWWDKDMMLE